MEDVVSLSEDFKKKMAVFISIKENDKLVVADGNLYIDNNSLYIQPLTRWWYGQGRITTMIMIQNELDTYSSFINFVRGAYLNKNTIASHYAKLHEIHTHHIDIVNGIISGLTHLKKTYSECTIMTDKLNIEISKLNHLPKII
jgi:hypothetical protein